jgi:hypothetical protein
MELKVSESKIKEQMEIRREIEESKILLSLK